MGVKSKSEKIKLIGLSGTLIVLGGFLVWTATDRLVARTISRFSPQIEKELSKSLGHPITIGSFKGLRPWGIELGQTKILPGLKDSSSIKISALTIKFAPFSSLISWRPIVIFNPKVTDIILSQNEEGSFWVLGPSKKSKETNLELRFNIRDKTRIIFKSAETEFFGKANLSLNLAKKKISGSINLDSLKYGNLNLTGKGYWDGLEFKAKAKINKFKLDVIQKILNGGSNIFSKGSVNANLSLGIRKGILSCQGGVLVDNLKLRGGVLKEDLSTSKVNIKCNDNKIQLPKSDWKYGPWRISTSAKIPFKDPKQINIDLLSRITLNNVDDHSLDLKAKLPLSILDRKLSTGELKANLDLKSFPLSSLNAIGNSSISGKLNASGNIEGYLNSLKTSIAFSLDNPQINGIRLREKWIGTFKRLPEKNIWGSLEMNSEDSYIPGNVAMNLSKSGKINELTLKRLGGEITLKPQSNLFEWQANKFRLDRIEVSVPPEKSFKRIFGAISGKGVFSLEPFFVDGQLTLDYPSLLGLKLKEVSIKGKHENSKTYLTGELKPSERGVILVDFNKDSQFSLAAKISDVSPSWITATALEIPKLGLKYSEAMGKAKDLGRFLIGSTNSSIDSQLEVLTQSQLTLREEIASRNNMSVINPYDLLGNVNADLKLFGSDVSDLQLIAEASGKIWTKKLGNNNDAQIKPFRANFNGPLYSGEGYFSLFNFPLSMLTLIAPIPSEVNGRLGFNGKYRLGNESPEISADIEVKDAQLYNKRLVLEKGNVLFKDNYINLDLALREEDSLNPVELKGDFPLSSSLPIDLKIESHGDGLAFLTGLTKGNLSWISGSADMSLLIRGTTKKPYANGFLVLKEGVISLEGKEINNLESTIVFDFNRLEVRELSADISPNGALNGSGAISLFDAQLDENEPLFFSLEKTRLKTSFSDANFSSKITVKGSILNPKLSGEILISDGFIAAKKSNTSRNNSSRNQNSINKSGAGVIAISKTPEQHWDYESPLILFIQDKNAPASRMLSAGVPKGFSYINFDNLKLVLGPSLRLVSQPLASFDTEGVLFLNGDVDETLEVSGVVKLVSGYVNLFTTTFNLDRSEPNVAIFVPSMGLVPYVDVTLKSRVPDNVRDVSNFSSNGMASFGIGGSRFIKVEVTATGPADRISESFQLRSTPNLARGELLGLIGGNSLTKLLSGGEGDVLASLLNRSFVSFLQGNINGVLSERLQVALYPAYVNGSELDKKGNEGGSANKEQGDGNLLTQQSWVTEIGFDLNERMNFSVQAIPNRQDVLPQGNITFQVNPNIGILGSFDTNGTWQSQVQVFLRY